ncbi:MAG: TetR/AcrR family transcriptional regulator [Actinobacteria bacterium]|nr:MAG: TetR/AcrR family transcriptional regulator [Actinomycetota bacterium]
MTDRDTRERIIDAAIDLFNELGTGAATTNHIARAAGISPGNLYYHFRNKEEIILAIYERAISVYDNVWREAGAAPPGPEVMLDLLHKAFTHQWKYRCLQREFPVLVRRDEALASRYREMQDRRREMFRALFASWIDAGYARPLSDDQLDDVILASWVLGETWFAYIASMGRADDIGELRRGGRLVYTIIRPHLTEETAERMDAVLLQGGRG